MRLCAALAAMAPPALLPILCDAVEAVPPSGFARQGIRCILRNQVLGGIDVTAALYVQNLRFCSMAWFGGLLSLRMDVCT